LLKAQKIGVLALQGGVAEHMKASESAAQNLKIRCEIIEVRTKKDLHGLDGLIIPGGESTVHSKLLEREDMLAEMRKVRKIFGTCAGMIMLAKKVEGKIKGQKTLSLMDIEVSRNAYGTQLDSFEQGLDTGLGRINAVFIRAPRMKGIGRKVKVLAKLGNEPVAVYESAPNGRHYLACAFHPELSTSKFHELFLSL
jgi:5'-phosphate synthase pdxT subunit